MTHPSLFPIYHLIPADYYHRQPLDQPYLPPTFDLEGFIHCTSGVDTLLEVANAFFADLSGDLLALEIDPTRLTAPLKFEPPIPPPQAAAAPPVKSSLFPHLYGPLNRAAIVQTITLTRNPAGRWQWNH